MGLFFMIVMVIALGSLMSSYVDVVNEPDRK